MKTTRLTGLVLACLSLAALFAACQGSNPSLSGPRPRSREAAGEREELPFEANTSDRTAIDTTGGELTYRQCKITVPRDAVPEPVFMEISIPDLPPEGMFPESAHQINPDGLELNRDALLTIAYYDEDIPVGKDEERIVIVHSLNGVWVELSNSKVHPHTNTVEAPIRFLGLYALRIASEDPRRLNTPPVALFEFSEQPYPEAEGTPFEQAKLQTEPQPEEEPAEEEPAEEGEEPRPGEGKEPPEREAPDTMQLPGQAKVTERYVVGGPEEREEAQAGSSANVAETQSPVRVLRDDEAQPVKAETPEVTVYFNASNSYDPDGEVVQYDWDFNSDGIFDYTSHSRPYAEYTFKYNGDYSVALKVTDNGRYSQAGYTTGLVRVRNAKAQPKPISATIAAYPPFGPSPHTANMAATTTSGTPPYKYKWTFSDGSESILANPYTTYPEPGGHTIRFEVTDVDGEALEGSVFVQSLDREAPVTPQPQMELLITPTTDRGQAPFTGKFKLAVERATEPVTYRVTFGDEAPGDEGLITNDKTFSHVYPNTGFYLVNVIATDSDLRTASTFATVHAFAPASPRDFTVSDLKAGGDPFSFGHEMHIGIDYTEASERTVRFYPEDTPADASKLAYQWDFGDGNYSTEQEPVHTFARDGIYEVRLTAGDGLQRWRQRIWLPVSKDDPAVAIQRPAYLEGPAPLGLSWDAIVTRGEEPLRYDWHFGQARRSDPSTYYTFQLPGDYEVKLNVNDKWDQPINAPLIKVKVRPGPVDYRMPLAVIQPVAGSTRAVVLDYTAANPLPLSSPHVEGPVRMIDLSDDGQLLGIVGDEGLIVKRTASGQPVISFLPAAGEIAALRVLESDAAYVTVDTAGGLETYLLCPDCDPYYIGEGIIAGCSGAGGSLVLREGVDDELASHWLVKVDTAGGVTGEPRELGEIYETVLTRDGRYLFFINEDRRIVKRNLADGDDEFLTGGDDHKFGLAVSDEGNAIAFASHFKGRKDVIIGRYTYDGVFRLASMTDQTGFYSEQLSLSADGTYLLAYGSRKELARLLGEDKQLAGAGDEAPEETLGDDEAVVLDGEAVENGEAEAVSDEELVLEGEQAVADEEIMPQPPRRRERFGVIRFNLSASPESWTISNINPRFISECQAQFDNAGPF